MSEFKAWLEKNKKRLSPVEDLIPQIQSGKITEEFVSIQDFGEWAFKEFDVFKNDLTGLASSHVLLIDIAFACLEEKAVEKRLKEMK